jgi:hypothetical protein
MTSRTSANARHLTKKVVVMTTGLVLVGGAAFAYWTAGGSGSGSAATGTNAAITAVQTSTVSAMAPGDAAQALSGNFNNGNSGPVYVATVTASIASVTKGVSAPAGTCDASDYTLANAVATVNAEVAAGNSQGAWSGASIKFNNKALVNQDACKNAVVTLAYAIS